MDFFYLRRLGLNNWYGWNIKKSQSNLDLLPYVMNPPV